MATYTHIHMLSHRYQASIVHTRRAIIVINRSSTVVQNIPVSNAQHTPPPLLLIKHITRTIQPQLLQAVAEELTHNKSLLFSPLGALYVSSWRKQEAAAAAAPSSSGCANVDESLAHTHQMRINDNFTHKHPVGMVPDSFDQ